MADQSGLTGEERSKFIDMCIRKAQELKRHS